MGGYLNIETIDLIPKCVEFVKQEFGINAYNIDVLSFFESNFESKKEEKWNVIFAFDVIEHLTKNKIVLLMRYIYSALNKNGIFIARVHDGVNPPRLYTRYSDFTHEIVFIPLSMNELSKAVGFLKITCLPEPELNKSFLKRIFKIS